MTLSAYTHVKQQVKMGVVTSECHGSLLNTLKGIFREEINSPRRFEQIDTIGELLKVLEIRDVLSEENVGSLKKIARQLPNAGELLIQINDYEDSYIPKEQGNYYANQNAQRKFQRGPTVNIVSNNPYGQMSEEKQRRILLKVIAEIGNSWRDLARNLGIREITINNIDNNNKKLGEKATELLSRYLESTAEPDRWFFELCDALEKSRRKDLCKDIKKILLMNI